MQELATEATARRHRADRGDAPESEASASDETASERPSTSGDGGGRDESVSPSEAAEGTDRRDDATATTPHVRLYVRGSSVAHDRESAVLEALEALADDGVIDAVNVHTWPEKVSLRSAGTARTDVLDTYQRFEAWADDHDVSIRPPFVVRQVDSSITRERDEVLVTPALCLTVWDGDDLVGVYPCNHEDGVETVEDGLANVADGAAASARRLAARVASEDRPVTPDGRLERPFREVQPDE
ncbi:HTH domain-containing protein [Halobacterium litoreum]|uniref:HTH domain-containing protein n=1 Tax=Halobacterium litoreum TaxID=2039234 RepID=A0ABD5NB98_9EURY|nr:HTH domain-containing protein [Halobacterium litoreum]UHH14547.1 hypothetical protein LT972_05990 [Halobacterium litoreum]